MTREHSLDAFLGEPRMERAVLFDAERFPNLVTTTEGTVIATWGTNHLVARRSADGGATWDAAVCLGQGMQGGGTLVDETHGHVLAFSHPEHAPKDGAYAERTLYRSPDDGRAWTAEAPQTLPDDNGNWPALHFSEHGITLQRGAKKGRLLRPARVFQKPRGYNTALYSDDHGATWRPSAPFPVDGTGEGCVEELCDGTVYYNSRKHFFEDDEPRRTERLQALSRDGGRTWEDAAYHANLPDGPRYRGQEQRAACWNGHFGLAGGLTRLPLQERDVLIYSNVDQPEHTRHRMSVWASFDGGGTWPVKRLVDEGPSAYSSLIAGRPGTASEGWVFLLFEQWGEQKGRIGPESAGVLVRFNLAWLLQGEATGDGALPTWLGTEPKG